MMGRHIYRLITSLVRFPCAKVSMRWGAFMVLITPLLVNSTGMISLLTWDTFAHMFFKLVSLLNLRILNGKNNEAKFEAWCEGKTGFPIADAGMRELNQTGYMHNRVRIITASFLIKNLNIDWHWGERYFTQKLVDCAPAINNGNWQWVRQ